MNTEGSVEEILPQWTKRLPTREEIANIIRKLMVKRWKDKRARKNIDRVNTAIESLREVQQAHLRRAIVHIKKEKDEQISESSSASKRSSDNQLQQERRIKDRTVTTSSGFTDSTPFSASSTLSHAPVPTQRKNNIQHSNSLQRNKDQYSTQNLSVELPQYEEARIKYTATPTIMKDNNKEISYSGKQTLHEYHFNNSKQAQRPSEENESNECMLQGNSSTTTAQQKGSNYIQDSSLHNQQHRVSCQKTADNYTGIKSTSTTNKADIRQQSNSSGGATLSYTHGENRTYEEEKAKEDYRGDYQNGDTMGESSGNTHAFTENSAAQQSGSPEEQSSKQQKPKQSGNQHETNDIQHDDNIHETEAESSAAKQDSSAASKQDNGDTLNNDDPIINPGPPTTMEEEMDKMFDSDSYPAVDEIINATTPKEGENFRSLKDAFYRYALYARKSGFSVKKFSSKRSRKDNEIYYQFFTCNKEGVTNNDVNPGRKRRTASLVKTGCEAHITVHKWEKGWFIKKVQLEHNHPLEPTDYLIRFSHCHKRMTPLDRKLIDLLQMGRLPPRKMMLIFRSIRGRFRSIPFDAVDLSNIQSHQNEIEKDHDIDHCLERFKTLQKKVPGFYYAIEKDDQKRVRSLFWMDAMCVMNYKLFGEYISFDTTFSTNKYNLPFVPIIGVNNHGSTVLFGVALLKDEKIGSFKWVLQTFVQAMGGKEPKTIITDQDKAMKRAIQEVLKNTTHRNCYYHIVTKMSQKQASFFALHPELSDLLRMIAKNSFNPEEFETAWSNAIRANGAEGEKHLKKLYRIRDRWVPAYFMDKFYPFSSSTGRSESTNNMWKCYSRNTDTITKFLEQYEVIQDKCLSDLDKKKIKSSLKTGKTITHHPFEKQALDAYTHDIFLKFQTEISNNTAFAILGEVTPGHFRLQRVSRYEKMEFARVYFDVYHDEEKKNFSCTCKKMQRDGIHCCHVIRVLVQLGITVLPDSFIIRRWRKDIELELPTLGDAKDDYGAEETLRFAGAMSNMAEMCNLACPVDRAYKVMMECMRDMRTKVMAELAGQENTAEEAEDTNDTDRLHDPPITKRKTTNRGDRPKPGSEKSSKARKITCGHCKQLGHTRKTCSALKAELAAAAANRQNTTQTDNNEQEQNSQHGQQTQQRQNTENRCNHTQNRNSTTPYNRYSSPQYNDGRIRRGFPYWLYGEES